MNNLPSITNICTDGLQHSRQKQCKYATTKWASNNWTTLFATTQSQFMLLPISRKLIRNNMH